MLMLLLQCSFLERDSTNCNTDMAAHGEKVTFNQSGTVDIDVGMLACTACTVSKAYIYNESPTLVSITQKVKHPCAGETVPLH